MEPSTSVRPNPGFEPPFPLVKAKIVPPPIPARLAPLPALERLRRTSDAQVIMVMAPAGYGKTTTLAHWARQSRKLVIWLALEAADNYPSSFWDHVVRAMHTTLPGLLPTHPFSRFQRDPSASLSAAAMTCQALEGVKTPTLIVLDDYHHIDSTNHELQHAIGYLMEHLPPGHQIAILSRGISPLPHARLRLNDQLLELQTPQFCLTPEATQQFIADELGVVLDDSTLHKFAATTEGWITGLILAAKTWKSQRAPLATAFGAHIYRFIDEYFEEEVFSPLPPQWQEFLMSTAVFSACSAELCDAFLQRGDSQQLLETLERSHLFIKPLEKHPGWYRYHTLFAQFLRQRQGWQSQVHQPGDRDVIQHLATQGFQREAAQLALATRDFDRLARLVTQMTIAWFDTEHQSDIVYWLEKVPLPIVHTHSRLRLVRSLLRLGQGEWGETFATDVGADHDGLAAAQQTLAAFHAGDMSTAIAAGQTALERLPPGGLQQGLLRYLCLACCYAALLGKGSVSNATEFASRLLHAPGGDQEKAEPWSALLMGTICSFQGDLHRTLELLRHSHQPLIQSSAFLHTSGVFLAQVQALYEHNALDDAEVLLRQALDQPIVVASAWLTSMYLLWLGRVQWGRGDQHGALGCLTEALSQADRSLSWQNCWRMALIVQLAGDLGQLEIAQEWAALLHHSALSSLPLPTRLLALRALAHLHLALGHVAYAAKVADQLIEATSDTLLKGEMVAAQIMKACTAIALHDEHTATTYLAQAVDQGFPMGMVRVFLDEDQALWPLLSRIKQHSMPEFQSLQCAVTSLLQAFSANGAVPDPQDLPAAPEAPALLFDPLTKREVEVLVLLAGGASNKEIARTLVIAHGTVKRHISNIFLKLNANRRTQAIARARALHVLADGDVP